MPWNWFATLFVLLCATGVHTLELKPASCTASSSNLDDGSFSCEKAIDGVDTWESEWGTDKELAGAWIRVAFAEAVVLEEIRMRQRACYGDQIAAVRIEREAAPDTVFFLTQNPELSAGSCWKADVHQDVIAMTPAVSTSYVNIVLLSFGTAVDGNSIPGFRSLEFYGKVGSTSPVASATPTQGPTTTQTPVPAPPPPPPMSVVGVWTTLAPLPTADMFAYAVTLNSDIFVVSGQAGGTWKYTVLDDVWVSAASLPVSAIGAASGAIANFDNVFCLGGTSEDGTAALDASQKYLALADTWTVVTPMPQPCNAAHAVSVGDHLLRLGGLYPTAGGATTDVYKYTVVDDVWLGVSPRPISQPGASVAIESLVFSIAGLASGRVSNVFRYDFSQDFWSGMVPVPFPVYGNAAVAVSGGLYSLGGDVEPDSRTGISHRFVWDADTWTTTTAMPTQRSMFAVASFGCSFFVFGGADTYDNIPITTVERHQLCGSPLQSPSAAPSPTADEPSTPVSSSSTPSPSSSPTPSPAPPPTPTAPPASTIPSATPPSSSSPSTGGTDGPVSTPSPSSSPSTGGAVGPVSTPSPSSSPSTNTDDPISTPSPFAPSGPPTTPSPSALLQGAVSLTPPPAMSSVPTLPGADNVGVIVGVSVGATVAVVVVVVLVLKRNNLPCRTASVHPLENDQAAYAPQPLPAIRPACAKDDTDGIPKTETFQDPATKDTS